MDKKKKFIAVIGKCKAGKSTIIASLTGCRNRGYQGMVTNNESGESIYVIVNSPQEERLSKKNEIKGTEKEIFQHILTQVKETKDCLGLVMAIRPSKPRSKEILSLEDIVQEILKYKNDFDLYLFVLDPAYNPEGSSDFIELSNRLEKLDLSKPRKLNGERFALINAFKINQETQLFPELL